MARAEQWSALEEWYWENFYWGLFDRRCRCGAVKKPGVSMCADCKRLA